MSGGLKAKDKARRNRFYIEQKGKCWWCKCDMIHWNEYQKDDKFRLTHKVPPNGATVDHLRDRFHPMRRDHANGERRWRIACSACNHKRGKESCAAQSSEELRK